MVKKQKVEKEVSSKQDISKSKSLPLEQLNHSLENELEFPTSLNQELEELLKKDKKRFFGGCGG
jgi:hypothetical protein